MSIKSKILSVLNLSKPEVSKPDFRDNIFVNKVVDFTKFEKVFDVGSHIGKTAVTIHNLNPNATIYCFEPYSESFLELKKNTSAINKIYAFNQALSSNVGESVLNINSFVETNSLFSANKVSKQIDDLTTLISSEKVRVNTLDAFCKEMKISSVDFIKIDVQGASYQVLEGGRNFLMNGGAKYIYAEVDFLSIYEGEKFFSEIEIFLRSLGYNFHSFFNMNYVENKLAWADALFYNKSIDV